MPDPQSCCDRLAECHELLRSFVTDRRLAGYVPARCRHLLERHGVPLSVGPLPEIEPETPAGDPPAEHPEKVAGHAPEAWRSGV